MIDDAIEPPDEFEDDPDPIDADPSEAARPAVGMILGASLMLLGFVLVAIAIAGPRDDAQVAADSVGLTVTTDPSAVGEGIGVGTTAPITDAGIGVGFAPPRAGRETLRGFGESTITVTSGTGKVCELCVLTASTNEQRARGLMEVTDVELGGYDGMLFEYPEEVEGSFWMRNTPLPLSIAYFDSMGKLVSIANMEPCGDSEGCPSYPAEGPFRFALEVPQGALADSGVVGAAELRIEARGCVR